MRRRRWGWLLGLTVLACHGVGAQQAETLPMYEDQLAGVKLGWQARTITGVWNFDNISPMIQFRLRRTYGMPDHIIMRLGTKIPLFTGGGSGPSGTYNFYMYPYGRGNSLAAAGGGGEGGEAGPGGAEAGPPQAMGPSDREVQDKVRRFLAEAQAPGAAPGAPGPAAPAPAAPGAEAIPGEQGAGPAAPAPTVPRQPADQAEKEFRRLQELSQQMARRWLALEDTYRLRAVSDDATSEELAALRQQSTNLLIQALAMYVRSIEIGVMSRTLGGEADAALAGFNLYYHVFHVGNPQRDIVFCYRMGLDTWLSVTVNFYTWQVNGITVANSRGTWDGARTSPGANGVRGIALGDSLQRVFERYGWPDGWESFYGRYLLLHYYDTNNVGFMLDHPAPKVWRVIRMIIEPRPNGQERQLGGVQLGLNAQQLLTLRYPNGRIVYGEPYAIERPNHRISVVSRAPDPSNWPPGTPLDPTVFGGTSLSALLARLAPGAEAALDSAAGGAAAGAAGAGPGEGAEGAGGPQAPTNLPRGATGGGVDVGAPAIATPAAAVVASRPGTRRTAATDRSGRPAAQAQAPPGDAGLPGEAGLGEAGGAEAAGGGGGNVICRYPMPFAYARDGMNVEALCGPGGAPAGDQGAAAGGAGPAGAAPEAAGGAPGGEGAGPGGAAAGGGAGAASRATLAATLSMLYGDSSGQTGFAIAYGCRSSPACPVDLAIPETQFRFDYTFAQAAAIRAQEQLAGDTKVEFGLDIDGLCTQIGVMGVRWGGARTKRGIALGSSLKDVLLRYGPPFLYDEFVDDVAEQQPNLSFLSYARDELGRPMGNLNMVMQDKRITAIQIVQLGVR